MNKSFCQLSGLVVAGVFAVMPVSAQRMLPSAKANLILATTTDKSLSYLAHADTIPVVGTARQSYTAATNADWLTATRSASGLVLSAAFNDGEARTANVTLTSGTTTKTLTVTQEANAIKNLLPVQIKVSSASASSEETVAENTPLANAYDDDPTTFYHSKWYGGETTFPVTLTFTLPSGTHRLSRIEYLPRVVGNASGRFKEVEVQISTNIYSSSFTSVGKITFTNTSNAQSFVFSSPQSGVRRVRLSVKSGYDAFISASEIRFYDESGADSFVPSKLFADDLCTQLKSGVTQADITAEENTLLKHLAQETFDGNYSTRWRVGTFAAYRPIEELRSQTLHTNSAFCPHENPTGIYFRSGETVAVLVKGIGSSPVALEVYDVSPVKNNGGYVSSTYSLHNGLNFITPTNEGNGYLNYYTSSFASAPEVSIHVIDGIQNGVFRMGDSNALWKALLASAKAPVLDILTPHVQVIAPVDVLSWSCPDDGAALAAIMDSTVRRSWEIMGYYYQGVAPRNHQFVQPSYEGMFANYNGSHAGWSIFHDWTRPHDFGVWGFAHELGHNTQITPFCWNGMTEVTNNVCSLWSQYNLRQLLSKPDLRLDDEVIECAAGWLRGGRLQNFIDEDVTCNLQHPDGHRYYWDTERDVNGSGTDVFVTLVPLWQMMLYTEVAAKSPNAFPKMYTQMRLKDATLNVLSPENLRLNWYRAICDAAQLNFIPFFDKAGMLEALDNVFVSDYTDHTYNITAAQFASVRSDVNAKNYVAVPAELVYMTAYNADLFRDNVLLTSTPAVNTGCTAETLNGHAMVKIDNQRWRGAVGYETYDASGKLLHATIFGLGDDACSNRYTHVIWKLSSDTATPSYIMAVGIDGKRVKCYQR
ncbi:MAG: M60 family metallopeptidase [Bacteroidaceae bacterium]|nr:M60 family metallopeptidase [Bacteroidaceae bacterium]